MGSFGLVYIHTMACLWFMLGRTGPSDTGNFWLDFQPSSEDRSSTIRDAGRTYQYTVAFHWTVAQLTLGGVDFFGTNTLERTFSILQLLIGLLLGSTVISLLSAIIIEIVVSRQQREAVHEDLRRFNRDHAVPTHLAVQAMKQAMARLSEKAPLNEANVVALSLLPTSLKDTILRETRLPHILTHVLFQLCGEVEITVIYDLCDTSVGLDSVSSNDEIFNGGQRGDLMYYLVAGHYQYIQEPTFSLVFEEFSTKVAAGAWVSESALWCEWTHVGTLTSTTVGVFLTVSASAMDIIQQYPNVCPLVKTYGRNFHARVTTAIPPFATLPTDLHVPFTHPSDLMPVQVPLKLLRQAVTDKAVLLSEAQLLQFEEELRKEQCALHRMSAGHLVRRVYLSLVRIENESGQILSQVGEHKNAPGAEMKVSIQIPGGKRSRSEPAQPVLERLVEDLFPEPLRSQVFFTGRADHKLQTRESASYGVPSVYVQSIHYAALNYEEDVEPIPAELAAWVPENLDIPGLSDILPRIVYAVLDGGGQNRIRYFSWLESHELDFFATSRGEKLLKQWLASVSRKTPESELMPSALVDKVDGAQPYDGQWA